jgi:predicted ATPase
VVPSVALGTDAGASGVLLERAAELSMLVDRLEAVEHSSRGHVLLVGGEAGVGKTTLVRRFCEGLGRSARVLWGACEPLFTPSPLGPLLAVAEGTGGGLAAAVERGAMPYEVVTALAPGACASAGPAGCHAARDPPRDGTPPA